MTNTKPSTSSKPLHFIGLVGKTNTASDYKPSYFVPKLAVGGLVCLLLAALTTCTPAPAQAQPVQPSKLEVLAWYSAGNIEQRLQECGTAAGLTMQLIQRIKQGLAVKEAIALHTQAVSTMSEIKKEIYNDAFYSAMMLQSEGRSKEEILNFVVKQCSH